MRHDTYWIKESSIARLLEEAEDLSKPPFHFIPIWLQRVIGSAMVFGWAALVSFLSIAIQKSGALEIALLLYGISSVGLAFYIVHAERRQRKWRDLVIAEIHRRREADATKE